MEVVTESVLAKLNQLRRRGVIIVGDEFTVPALMVDYRIQSVNRNTYDPAGTKRELQKLGKMLAALLDKYCPRPAIASNADLVVRQRGTDAADYLFVVNDKRTFGEYVGQWKMVQEKGLPNSGTISLRHPAVAAYDLTAHKALALKKQNNGCSFDVSLAPGDGKLVLLLDREISNISLQLPQFVEQRAGYTVKCRITDRNGVAIPAYIPVEIKMVAANGIQLPGSGFYAAVNGELTVNEVMASNAPAGVVHVTARCLASNKTASGTFNVVKGVNNKKFTDK